jgi:hypothetical protein
MALSASGASAEAIPELDAAWRRTPSPLSAADRAACGQALAWSLATTADDALRDGARALAIARETSRLAAGRAGPGLLETLAAASAETGDFESAVHYETEALKTIPPAGQAGARARLALYTAKRPYRQP